MNINEKKIWEKNKSVNESVQERQEWSIYWVFASCVVELNNKKIEIDAFVS